LTAILPVTNDQDVCTVESESNLSSGIPATDNIRALAAIQNEKSEGPAMIFACSASSIDALRLLNMSLFPVQYPKSFYRGILKDPRLCHYARCDDTLVGAIVVQRERDKKRQPTTCMEVALIGVLALYRRRGIGRQLMAEVTWVLRTEVDLAAEIRSICLHVHVVNTEAQSFYASLGFTVAGEVDGYYPRLSPTTALKLRLAL
jgi:ribosomal protein S18 acetylase RimI-like enzyme